MDVGEQLTKSRKLQQSKESTSGHLLPVQLKVLPVQLAGKSTVVKFYRYNLKFYRYNFWKINSSEVLPVQLKVLPVQLAGKSTVVKFYRYNLKLYQYNCMELAGIVQEFNPYARALSSTNQNEKITLEGAIKGGGHK